MHARKWTYLKVFTSFLSDRYQRVVLKDQESSWVDAKACHKAQ